MPEAYIQETLWIVLLLSGIPLVASACTGLVAVVVQAATQLQEQTITFIVKFGTLCVVIAIGGQWAATLLVDFMQRIFASLAVMGRL